MHVELRYKLIMLYTICTCLYICTRETCIIPFPFLLKSLFCVHGIELWNWIPMSFCYPRHKPVPYMVTTVISNHSCDCGAQIIFTIWDALWQFNIAMENCHLLWVFPLKMVIFHSYVKLPEGGLKLPSTYATWGTSQPRSVFLTLWTCLPVTLVCGVSDSGHQDPPTVDDEG